MNGLILVVFCSVSGIIQATGDSTYKHMFIDDGGKLEPDIDLLSRKYTKNQHRKWSLHAESGVWALVFREFSLEYSVSCENDYLQIQEISNRTDDEPTPPIRYCGESVPPPYLSARPRLHVTFVSDNIWEMEGFLVQALHAPSQDQLAEKMKPFIEMAEKSRDTSRSSNAEQPVSSEHPAFYTLIGCSVGALIIFGVLLTYFVISIRRKQTEADSLYIRPTSVGRGIKSRPSGGPTVAPAGFACKVGKSGKRYSKDNKNNNNNSDTARKTVAREPNVHHNNLYVSGNLSNNG